MGSKLHFCPWLETWHCFLFLTFIHLSYIRSRPQFLMPPLFPVFSSPTSSPSQINSFSVESDRQTERERQRQRQRETERQRKRKREPERAGLSGISTKHDLKWYETVHKPSYHSWTWKPRSRKRVLSAGKTLRDIPNSHSWELHKNTQLHNHKHMQRT